MGRMGQRFYPAQKLPTIPGDRTHKKKQSDRFSPRPHSPNEIHASSHNHALILKLICSHIYTLAHIFIQSCLL